MLLRKIRSLFAALEERRNKKFKPKKLVEKESRVVFTKEMKKTHTLLMPQMSPIHFDIAQEAFRASGYNVEVMPAIDKDCIDIGLKYVNNDACYPALIVVGQILRALQSGNYDLDKVSVLISQTGGGCRVLTTIRCWRRARPARLSNPVNYQFHAPSEKFSVRAVPFSSCGALPTSHTLRTAGP